MDWGCDDSDIDLEPISPLALSAVLDGRGGFLDLLPQAESAEGTEAEIPASTAEAANDRLQGEHQADRCRLQTRLTDADLLQQCKKILVENALVRDRSERQLYLCAGFLSWPAAGETTRRQRAPVLLYPALLVRIPDESRYEIRLAGTTPDYNQSLVSHAEQRFSVQLPAFDVAQPLRDFMAAVVKSLSSSESLQFEYDVAIGSAALFQSDSANGEIIALPDIPRHFNVPLAMSITGNKNLTQLSTVLQLIPDYANGHETTAQPISSVEPDHSIAGLRRYAAQLSAEGLENVEFGKLPTLPARLDRWTDLLLRSLASDTISSVLRVPELSARQLIRLASVIELIDKAPANIDQMGHGDLCFAHSTQLLKRAQHQARLIEEELTALQGCFLMDKIPAKSQLLNLITELGDVVHGPDLVDADYFNARRQFMEFSVDKPVHLTDEHRRQLSQLARVLRFRELYVNNVEYRAALGPAYKGLRTDWQVLNQLSDYARELADVLESEAIAAQLVRNWQIFRTAYSVEMETLQSGAEACRRLLGILGVRWQNQSASSLATQAQFASSRLSDWLVRYGPMESHADKTAAMVLANFSGDSSDDIVVETQADETRARIDRQLNDGTINREQIAHTLDWLRAASETASRHQMDIDAIVEHLQIA